MVEKSWQQVHEAAAPTLFGVREKTAMNATVQLSLFSPGPQQKKWCHSQLQLVFLPQITYSRQSLTGVARDTFPR